MANLRAKSRGGRALLRRSRQPARKGRLCPSARRLILESLEPRYLLSNWNGHITEDTIWNNTADPYVIVGDLFIDPGKTLSILPGVNVQDNNSSQGLRVNGTLSASGVTFGGDYQDIIVSSGGRGDLSNSMIVGSYSSVNYQSGSSGTLDNVCGSYWDLTIASSSVSVLNGSALDQLTLSASASISGSTIGYLNLNGGTPVVTGNTIGYLDLSAGSPTVTGNTFTDAGPLRVTDPDLLEVSGFVGNAYSASDPWVWYQGTLDGTRSLGLIDGVLGQYKLVGSLTIAVGGTLTLGSGVKLRCEYGMDILVSGGLAGTGATIELPGSSYYYATDVEVRSGGYWDFDGGTVYGPGQVFVRSGGRADLAGVTFANSVPVTYASGSMGLVDSSQGSWTLNVSWEHSGFVGATRRLHAGWQRLCFPGLAIAWTCSSFAAAAFARRVLPARRCPRL
jgi:hypothetical protein